MTCNQRAAESISDLQKIAVNLGGNFLPGLEFRVRDGNISVHAPRSATGPVVVMRVPVGMFPFLDDVSLPIRNNRFGVPSMIRALPPEAADTLHAVLALYNAADKLAAWRQTSPWFTLARHPEVLAQLLDARQPTAEQITYRRLLAAGDTDTLLRDSFLGTRKIAVSDRTLAALGRPASSGRVALPPLLDLLNHDPRADGYRSRFDGGAPHMQVLARPNGATGEVCVHYTRLDLVQAYLSYGYVDPDPPLLDSVPFEIHVQGRTLRVTASGEGPEAPQDPTLYRLRWHLPFIDRTGDGVSLSRLTIPGQQAPRALRRILAFVADALELQGPDHARAISQIEAALLERNRDYWEDLQKAAAGLAPGHALHRLIDTALGHIAAYRETLGCRSFAGAP